MREHSFSGRLKATRELAGDLTGRELARLARLNSEGTVGHVERGHTDSMRLESALAVSEVLGVDPWWLVTGVGPAPTAETVRSSVAAARARRADESGPLPAVEPTGTDS